MDRQADESLPSYCYTKVRNSVNSFCLNYIYWQPILRLISAVIQADKNMEHW